jgi:hypothetical protein
MADNAKVPPQGAGRDSDHHRRDLEDLALQRNPVHDLLDSFVGLEVDGGCDDCDAYQTIERIDVGVYVNHVFHDDTCPWWIRHQAATRGHR